MEDQESNSGVDFGGLLEGLNIPYERYENHLTVGETGHDNGWAVFVSVNSHQLKDLLSDIALELFDLKVPFRIIKNEGIAERVNNFWYGIHEVGRSITIYTGKQEVTETVIQRLSPLTDKYLGPQVLDTVRVEKVLYVSYLVFQEQKGDDEEVKWKFALNVPSIKKFPFKINDKYKYWKRKRLLKKRFVPLVLISRSPKGDLLKAIDIKGFRFDWCFVKEGKSNVFIDRHGRDISDRFKWQKRLLKELQDDVPMPRFVDYFEQDEECYLVMEYLEGISLSEKIEKIHSNRKWDDLLFSEQQQLIVYFLQAVDILRRMHKKGYVHRDATASNFMILPGGKLYTIDLELSFNLNTNEPLWPFSLGSFGYISPEQARVEQPTIKEDVYSVGALLLFTWTGHHPSYFIDLNHEINMSKLEESISNKKVLNLVLKCLSHLPEDRPGLNEVEQEIASMLSTKHIV